MNTLKTWFFDQMGMYSAYHRDGRNQLTHHLGVPVIVFSLMVLLADIGLGELAGVPVSQATVLISVLLLIYILVIPVVGLVAAAVYGVLLWGAHLVAGLGDTVALATFWGCFIGGWIVQFIGHGFEGRRPALFDNLLQIFMAPSFLIAEVFFALGLLKDTEARIHQHMQAYLPVEPTAEEKLA